MKRKLLSLLMALVAVCGVQRVAAQVSDGVYYLYNEDSKMFLSRGAAWATEAIIDKYGIAFQWTSEGGKIEFVDWKEDEHGGNDLYVTGTAIYTDNNGNGGGWTFEDAGEGKYYLKAKDNTYAKYDMGGFGYYVHTTANQGEATKWILKTKAERNAIVANYPQENYNNILKAAGINGVDNFKQYLSDHYVPVDKTSSIGTSTFSAGQLGNWTFSGDNSRLDIGDGYCASFDLAGNFTHSTITGLEKGIYKLTVDAFFRYGFPERNIELKNAGYEYLSTAYLKANDEQAQIKTWVEEKDEPDNPAVHTPYWPNEAVAAFNQGRYDNEVYVYVGDNGNLDITIGRATTVAHGEWFIFNNVTLTYYKNELSDEQKTSIIQSAQTIIDGDAPMQATIKEALTPAKAAFVADQSIPNYKALSEAISAANTSINVYASAKEVLDKTSRGLEGVSPYTYSADAYGTNYTAWKDKYDDRALTTDEANSLVEADKHRNTCPLSVILESLWKVGDQPAIENDKFYINTWSVEGNNDGSGMTTPFYEYWVGSGHLEPATFSATIEGLDDGTAYKVSALVRVQQENGQVKADDDVTFTVGGNTVNAADGTETSGGGYFYKTVEGIANPTDGKLTIQFNVKDGNHISWLSFKDITIEENVALTMTSAGWATLILPFAADVPDGLTAYTCEEEENGWLKLNEATSFEAYTPYIVKSEEPVVEDKVYNLSGDITTEKITAPQTHGVLTGVLIDGNAPDGSYVLQKGSEGVGFYHVESANIPIKANRVYVTLLVAHTNLRFLLPGDETAVDATAAEDAIVDVYHIGGTLVKSGVKAADALNGLPKGIYVVDGKKVMK